MRTKTSCMYKVFLIMLLGFFLKNFDHYYYRNYFALASVWLTRSKFKMVFIMIMVEVLKKI